jgi:hypothetical protein
MRYVAPYLLISVKPDYYMRDRFGQGCASYEKKMHGARTLRITLREFQQMADALKDEVELCHRILLEHDLVPKLEDARRAQQARKATSAE